MSLQDEIEDLLRRDNDLSDAELAMRTGRRHQHVNQSAHKLEKAGRTRRIKEPGHSILNHLLGPEER